MPCHICDFDRYHNTNWFSIKKWMESTGEQAKSSQKTPNVMNYSDIHVWKRCVCYFSTLYRRLHWSVLVCIHTIKGCGVNTVCTILLSKVYHWALILWYALHPVFVSRAVGFTASEHQRTQASRQLGLCCMKLENDLNWQMVTTTLSHSHLNSNTDKQPRY